LLLYEKIPLISSFFGRRLVFAGAHLFDEKIRLSAAQAIFRACLGDTKPPSNHKTYCTVSTCCFRDRFVGKDTGFVRTNKPSSEE